jgi:hypothetical protein
MFQRLKSARPTYSHTSLEKQFKKAKYIEGLIKFKHTNPNMYFETPEKFQKKLFNELNKDFKAENLNSTYSKGFGITNNNKFINSSTGFKSDRPGTSIGFAKRENEYKAHYDMNMS